MGKLRKMPGRALRSLPLGVAFVLFVVAFGVADVILSGQSVAWANKRKVEIEAAYSQNGEGKVSAQDDVTVGTDERENQTQDGVTDETDEGKNQAQDDVIEETWETIPQTQDGVTEGTGETKLQMQDSVMDVAGENELQAQDGMITENESGSDEILYLDDADSGEENIYISFPSGSYTEEDAAAIAGYQALAMGLPVFWSALCLILCAVSYYLLLMRKPLRVLADAFEKITDNNLDFTVESAGKNELAAACASMEKMRQALQENTREIVAMAEERKRLNDAYTHELRNPVAVLRGNMEIVAEYFPQGQMTEGDMLEKIQVMRNNVARIEAFLGSMNQIQKLEELTIRKDETETGSFFTILKSSAGMLCEMQNIRLEFENRVTAEKIAADTQAIQQVTENVLGNALRFAKSRIRVTCSLKNGFLNICVQDDGEGFSDGDLRRAGQCYYRGVNEKDEYHFGLGLYISSMLCEKHGGELKIGNAPEGGARVTARFFVE